MSRWWVRDYDTTPFFKEVDLLHFASQSSKLCEALDVVKQPFNGLNDTNFEQPNKCFFYCVGHEIPPFHCYLSFLEIRSNFYDHKVFRQTLVGVARA
jgi:hypothetical protein